MSTDSVVDLVMQAGVGALSLILLGWILKKWLPELIAQQQATMRQQREDFLQALARVDERDREREALFREELAAERKQREAHERAGVEMHQESKLAMARLTDTLKETQQVIRDSGFYRFPHLSDTDSEGERNVG